MHANDRPRIASSVKARLVSLLALLIVVAAVLGPAGCNGSNGPACAALIEIPGVEYTIDVSQLTFTQEIANQTKSLLFLLRTAGATSSCGSLWSSVGTGCGPGPFSSEALAPQRWTQLPFSFPGGVPAGSQTLSPSTGSLDVMIFATSNTSLLRPCGGDGDCGGDGLCAPVPGPLALTGGQRFCNGGSTSIVGGGCAEGTFDPDHELNVKITLQAPQLAPNADPSCATCVVGQSSCPGGCTDTTSDPSNCGQCNVVCASGQECVNSVCAATATSCTGAGFAQCGSACIDTTSDPANCGSCGVVCSAGVCTGGTCAPCVAPMIVCGDTCVDPSSDSFNCGGCFQGCSEGTLCLNGACTSCPPGSTYCSGTCVDTSSDSNNCGGCLQRCLPAGNPCVNGACAALTSCPSSPKTATSLAADARNCGACGAGCGLGEICANGACACPAPMVSCGGLCTDTATDGANCGACGHACPYAQGCYQGACVTEVCLSANAQPAPCSPTTANAPPEDPFWYAVLDPLPVAQAPCTSIVRANYALQQRYLAAFERTYPTLPGPSAAATTTLSRGDMRRPRTPSLSDAGADAAAADASTTATPSLAAGVQVSQLCSLSDSVQSCTQDPVQAASFDLAQAPLATAWSGASFDNQPLEGYALADAGSGYFAALNDDAGITTSPALQIIAAGASQGPVSVLTLVPVQSDGGLGGSVTTQPFPYDCSKLFYDAAGARPVTLPRLDNPTQCNNSNGTSAYDMAVQILNQGLFFQYGFSGPNGAISPPLQSLDDWQYPQYTCLTWLVQEINRTSGCAPWPGPPADTRNYYLASFHDLLEYLVMPSGGVFAQVNEHDLTAAALAAMRQGMLAGLPSSDYPKVSSGGYFTLLVLPKRLGPFIGSWAAGSTTYQWTGGDSNAVQAVQLFGDSIPLLGLPNSYAPTVADGGVDGGDGGAGTPDAGAGGGFDAGPDAGSGPIQAATDFVFVFVDPSGCGSCPPVTRTVKQ
jgi:hypothetical protein